MAASVIIKKNNDIEFQDQPVQFIDSGEDTGLRLKWPKFTKEKPKYIRDDVLIFIIPGMTGTCDDVYINKLVEYTAFVYQYQSVVYHYRMVGETVPKKINQPFDLTEDLSNTLDFIKKYHPQYKHIYAIGHSYGANQLVNYLGETGENSLIKGGVSVANPYCLVTAFRLMKGKLYDMLILFLFSSHLKTKKEQFNRVQKALNIDLQKSIDSKSTDELISEFNSKLLGYKTIGHYQRDHSSVRQIHKIQVPLLGISSEDDQISHKRGIPKEEFKQNPNCMLMVTKAGGHVGFVEQTQNKNYRFWYFQPSLEYLQAVMDIDKI